MQRLRSALSIFTISCLFLQAGAQQYIFKNYTANDGLVANAIRQIHQDKKGFLWFGTLEGLSKYDGHRFTNYTTANGLSNNYINHFYEAGDGTLYVAANDGSITMAAENKLIPCIQPSASVINRFLRTPEGRTIVSTDFHGLAEFRNNNLHALNQLYPGSSYYEITHLNDSLFIAVNDSSLQVLNYRCEVFSMLQKSNAYFTDYIIFKDSQKRIWAGAHWGLQQIKWPLKKGEPLSFLPLPPAFDIPLLRQNHITAIFEDNAGIIWIGTSKGLLKMNPDGTHQWLTMQDGLADNNITYIFQDREMNLWFGTTGGLSKLVTTSGIRIYTTQNGLALNALSFVSRFKKNNLLLFSSGGLQVFNIEYEKAVTISNPSNLYFYDKVINSHPALLLAKGQINTVDTVSERIKNAYSLNDGYYNLATADHKTNFFLYSTTGLYFTNGKRAPAKILEARTQSVVVDKKGLLWAGTWWYGLYLFKYTVQSDSIIIHSTEHYFPGERFRSMFMDSQGNIWAGTRQHGVYIFKAGNPNDYIILNQHKGLQSDFVKQIAEDEEGNIWLAYFQGIDKLVKKDGEYRIFNFSRVNNFYPVTNSMEYDGENSIWLVTQNGLVRITCNKMSHSLPLPVYITKISSTDSVYSSSIPSPQFSYNKNRVQFEFSAPGFINEKQILYSYRLTGSENNEWSTPSNEHTVSFASMRAGSYTFAVRSQGWNGEWGPVTSYSFKIKPPFWQTGWFITTCILVIAGLITWLVRRRIKNIRHEAAMKQKINETEMAALRSHMNPHFIFNCLNAIDNLIQTGQKDKATTYLTRFARLLRNVLDNSKNNMVSFQKDFESLQLYLQMEQFRCGNRFEYELMADDELINGDYKVPPMIVQPFVENAIHHGLLNKQNNGRKLTVTAEISNGFIQYIVTDNGIGREKARQLLQINKPGHRSYGIQITEERVQLYNQSKIPVDDVRITDLYENNQPFGTKVVIRLKIADNI